MDDAGTVVWMVVRKAERRPFCGEPPKMGVRGRLGWPKPPKQKQLVLGAVKDPFWSRF